MARRLGWIMIAWMLALCVVLAVVYGHPAARPSLTDRTLALAAELRCPICHGESVADSTTDIARSIRALIRQRLSQGQSPDAIKQYLASRYGSSIVLAPPTSGIGGIAWLAPLLLLLGGLGLLVMLIAGWRARARLPVSERPGHLERMLADLAADSRGDGQVGAEVTR